MNSQHHQLPLLALSFDNEENRVEEDVDFTLTSLLSQRTPPAPWNPTSRGTDNQLVQRNEPNALATRILEHGSISFAALQVSTQIIVDISGIPLIESVAVLKSLIIDSWIIASNTLAPLAGRSRPEEAVVRALIMLLAKRFIGIKQLGLVRNIIVLLSFVKLASAAMTATNFHEELAPTLNQIASIPFLIYTALARIVVDKSAETWLAHAFRDASKLASESQIYADAKGRIGKNGEKLKASWKAELEKRQELKAYVRRNALINRDQVKASLSEFASVWQL